MIWTRFLVASILVILFAHIVIVNNNNNNNYYYYPYTSSNNNVVSPEILPIDAAFGPESLTFDPTGGGPYAGVSDGRILKWVSHQRRWILFAFTSPNREACEKKHDDDDDDEKEHICGRPLGLRFNEKTGELYIADAYFGLLVVGPNGGLATTLVNQVHGLPLVFTNGLDIDQSNGLVYFTSSSSLFPRRNYMSIILSNDKTGRLFRYDPGTKQVTTLVSNLTFPNGVSLTDNNESLLLVETTSCTILRYSLKHDDDDEDGKRLQVLTQLPGFPDNIKSNSKGEYWVGVYSKRSKVLKWLLSFPWVGNTIINLNGVKLVSVFTRLRAIGMAVKLDKDGNILQVLEDKSGKLKFVSEVMEKDGDLWFGSVILPYASLYKGYNS